MMRTGKPHVKGFLRFLAIVLLLILSVTVAVSCGAEKVEEKPVLKDGAKLPPGVTESDLEETSTGQIPETENEEEEAPTTRPASPGATADLVGGRVTVVSATRQDSNADVISGDQREVKGDYLEVELTVENVGDDLIDLSHYSFRLESPGIAAATYADYYGNEETYGKYVGENVISATLLDYANLQPVGYRVKIGELVDKVFLFFDLNPESTARNEGVTKENTNLIIRKVRGTDYGEEVSIDLAGYPDK